MRPESDTRFRGRAGPVRPLPRLLASAGVAMTPAGPETGMRIRHPGPQAHGSESLGESGAGPQLMAGNGSDLVQDPAEEGLCFSGRERLAGQPVQDTPVVQAVGGLVQVYSARVLFEVHHVVEFGFGKAEDGDRAVGDRLAATAERRDLDVDVAEPGHLDEVPELGARHGGAPDRAAQRRFVNHCPQLRRGRPVQYLLAAYPHTGQLLGIQSGVIVGSDLEHGASIVRGLQQARDELRFVGADGFRGFVQPEIRREPGRYYIAVRLPPAGRVGISGHGEQRCALILADPVQVGQVVDVSRLDPGAARFHAADLRLGTADRISGCLPADPSGCSQFPQPRAEQNPDSRRPCLLVAENPAGLVRLALRHAMITLGGNRHNIVLAIDQLQAVEVAPDLILAAYTVGGSAVLVVLHVQRIVEPWSTSEELYIATYPPDGRATPRAPMIVWAARSASSAGRRSGPDRPSAAARPGRWGQHRRSRCCLP